MKTILVTNDDGMYGPGLYPLIKELKKLKLPVLAVVPDQERSGTSHSITLHKPFRVRKVTDGVFCANGTPADCVRYGVRSLVQGQVCLVVSGINAGPNLGQDVVYSGTVAGAREGALLKIPSVALSTAENVNADFSVAAKAALRIARRMLAVDFPAQVYLNVNVPNTPRGMRMTRLGQRVYDQTIECRTDPRGQKYYWLAGKHVAGVHKPGTDYTMVTNSYISITPLKLDPTAAELLEPLRYFEEK
jgi:5'-nucleotidase